MSGPAVRTAPRHGWPNTWPNADLAGIRFDDSSGDQFRRSWIMLLPEGQFDHPTFGRINLSRGVLDEMVRHFQDGTRGIELALDYDHRAGTTGDSRAPGWIEALEYRPAQPTPGTPSGVMPAGLWARVRWTPLGLSDVQNQIYRYISAEFRPVYKDDLSGAISRNVVIGATLTNRPFMKQMPAVALALAEGEHMDEHVDEHEENEELDEERDALDPLDPEAPAEGGAAGEDEPQTDVEDEPEQPAPGASPEQPAAQLSEAVARMSEVQLRELVAVQARRLYERDVEDRLRAWARGARPAAGGTSGGDARTVLLREVAAVGSADTMDGITAQLAETQVGLSRRFSDAYRALMLSKAGVMLSEAARAEVDQVISIALSTALVDMSRRGVAGFESDRLPGAGTPARARANARRGVISNVSDVADEIALSEHHVAWDTLLRTDRARAEAIWMRAEETARKAAPPAARGQ